MMYFRPDGVGTVTHEEKEKFQEIKERLRIQLENQITNFRLVQLQSYALHVVHLSVLVGTPADRY